MSGLFLKNFNGMEKLCLIGLMVFISIFGAAYCSEQIGEAVNKGKDTVAVTADSQFVYLPCSRKEEQNAEKDANGWAAFEFVRGIEGMIAKEPCCLRFVEFTYQGGSKRQYFAGFLGEKLVYRTEVRDTTLSLDNGFKIAIKNGVLKLYFDDKLCCTRSFNGTLRAEKTMELARITPILHFVQ